MDTFTPEFDSVCLEICFVWGRVNKQSRLSPLQVDRVTKQTAEQETILGSVQRHRLLLKFWLKSDQPQTWCRSMFTATTNRWTTFLLRWLSSAYWVCWSPRSQRVHPTLAAAIFNPEPVLEEILKMESHLKIFSMKQKSGLKGELSRSVLLISLQHIYLISHNFAFSAPNFLFVLLTRLQTFRVNLILSKHLRFSASPRFSPAQHIILVCNVRKVVRSI